MRIKEEYVLRSVADEWIVMNTNPESAHFNDIFALNDSAKFLWEKLAEGAEGSALVSAMAEQFDLDPAAAAVDADRFVRDMKDLGCFEDENE